MITSFDGIPGNVMRQCDAFSFDFEMVQPTDLFMKFQVWVLLKNCIHFTEKFIIMVRSDHFHVEVSATYWTHCAAMHNVHSIMIFLFLVCQN